MLAKLTSARKHCFKSLPIWYKEGKSILYFSEKIIYISYHYETEIYFSESKEVGRAVIIWIYWGSKERGKK